MRIIGGECVFAPDTTKPRRTHPPGLRLDLKVAGDVDRKYGSGGRTRTYDLVVNSHPLCQLSYAGTLASKSVRKLPQGAPGVKQKPLSVNLPVAASPAVNTIRRPVCNGVRYRGFGLDIPPGAVYYGFLFFPGGGIIGSEAA